MKVPKKTEKRVPYDPEVPLLGYSQTKLQFKKIHGPLCSQQYYLQQSRHGNKLSVH